METLDLMFRGGTIALCLLMIWHLSVARLGTEMRLAGIAFLVGEIAYTLAATPSSAFDSEALFMVARACPVFLWWFALCLFEDRPRHWVVATLVLAFLSNPHLSPSWATNVVHQIGVAALLGNVIYKALSGLREDLVEPRRQFRLTIGVLLPLTGLVIAYFELVPPDAGFALSLMLLQSAIFLVFSLGLMAWMTRLDTDLFPDASGPRPPRNVVDDSDLARLSAALGDGIHRIEGLTIGSLALQLGLPEHRLRQLINREMGYRNFSELVNDLRVDDAKAQLADPDGGRRQISQIAYEVGFASLAPFNRAFRARTGQSPSEFRRDALSL